MIVRVISSTWFVWALLALPAIAMFVALIGGSPGHNDASVAKALLHPTGETSARLLIITMAIIPLRMMFPSLRFWGWMLRHRRWFGVAAFAYAAFHTALYVIDIGALRAMLDEFLALGIWTGWLAFAIFVPLALTSNKAAVRGMKRNWRRLHRLVYVAAVATLAHWIFIHNAIGPALVHFVPLAGLEAYRLWRTYRSASRTDASEALANARR